MVVSRWFVMPMAATSCGRDLRPPERLDGDADLRRPDLLRVVLDPAGLGKDLRELLLRHRRDARRRWSKTMARELVVPWSRARM